MKKELITQLHKSFEDFVHSEEGVEYWFDRDIQQLLQYADWRNFLLVIDKAKKACENSNIDPEDHFVDVNKMIGIGKGGEREVADFKLTRISSTC